MVWFPTRTGRELTRTSEISSAGLAGADEEEAGDAEPEEQEREDRVRPHAEAAVHRAADHAEAVDRGQRDAERGEPGVEVPGRRQDGLAGAGAGEEEGADLEGVPAEDVPHWEGVVAEPHRG